MHLPRTLSLGSSHAGQISRLTSSLGSYVFQTSVVSFSGGEQNGNTFVVSVKMVKYSLGHFSTQALNETKV